MSSSILTDREIRAGLRCSPPLVADLLNEALQVQPCGVDLTVRSVSRLTSSGAIDFDNSGRVLASREELPWVDGWVELSCGGYHVVYGETVNLPHDVMALAYPRSSLLRCGAMLYSAVWDPGYSGRAEGLLVVHNPHGFRLGRRARIAQLVFTRLEDAVERPYDGRYLGENA